MNEAVLAIMLAAAPDSVLCPPTDIELARKPWRAYTCHCLARMGVPPDRPYPYTVTEPRKRRLK
jgi:hypothetical protein